MSRTAPGDEHEEVARLLGQLYQRTGHDFRRYSQAHILRRIRRRVELEAMSSVRELRLRMEEDESFVHTLFYDLSINYTEMFRDPPFYEAVRRHVIPILATYPYFKIWHAGCASGEELYSMAILIKEAGLLPRTRFYGTDMNEEILNRARQGIVTVEVLKNYTENYQKSGGTRSFSDYYTAHYDHALLDAELREQVLFANHNLVTDRVFGEMQMVVCRNVLIYFKRELQDHVLKLFYDSLCRGGILCLGIRESLAFSELADSFEVLVDGLQIYRKKYE